MMVKPYPTASVLNTAQVSSAPMRTTLGANPVNLPPAEKSTRPPLASVSPNATPRQKHPALNAEPWSRSYAQSRTQPKTATMKRKTSRMRKRVTKA